MSKLLSEDLQALPAGQVLRIAGDLDIPVKKGYVEDSRAVKKGSVFVARRGLNVDGHDYIVDAFTKGAVCAVISKNIDMEKFANRWTSRRLKQLSRMGLWR